MEDLLWRATDGQNDPSPEGVRREDIPPPSQAVSQLSPDHRSTFGSYLRRLAWIGSQTFSGGMMTAAVLWSRACMSGFVLWSGRQVHPPQAAPRCIGGSVRIGAPACLVWYHDFLYHAGSWAAPRRLVAKIEHHEGGLFMPRK